MKTKIGKASGAGFTLLELIAVMGIIVALSLVVAGSYSGMLRAISAQAGVNAIRKIVTLSRQHACVDGSRTYFWVTGLNTYVLCRKAGTVSARSTGARSGADLPPYLASSGGSYTALWIVDRYSDLGSSSESFDSSVSNTGNSDLGATMKTNGYNGALLFDLDKGLMARIQYPPWYDTRDDKWIMGVNSSTSGFDVGDIYGWALYPERQLPKGYVFDVAASDLDSNEKMKEGKRLSFYFEPDGSAGSEGNTMKVTVIELKSGNKSSVEVSTGGKITAKY